MNLVDRIADVLRKRKVGTYFGTYIEYAPRSIARKIARVVHPRIETAEQLANIVDQCGHEIVVLDNLGNAWQGVYDFEPEHYPATLLYTPGGTE